MALTELRSGFQSRCAVRHIKNQKEKDNSNLNNDLDWGEFCKDVENTDVFYKAAKETLAKGIPICYSPEDLPDDQYIMEYPDGRKELYRGWWKDGKMYEEKLRDIK